jgi:hypothetical protein
MVRRGEIKVSKDAGVLLVLGALIHVNAGDGLCSWNAGDLSPWSVVCVVESVTRWWQVRNKGASCLNADLRRKEKLPRNTFAEPRISRAYALGNLVPSC